jgi:protein SCO1/2
MTGNLPVSMPVVSDARPLGHVQRRVASLAARPVFWMAVVALGLAIPLITQMRRPAPPPLPVFGVVPDFRLLDQDGRPFGAADLRGRVWVGGFIFTRCPTICPAITARMAKLQRRARGIQSAFRLVSFSVDPGYDTPARLAAFARQANASPRMWKFLTGESDAMKAAVEEGLKISMGTPQGEQDFASLFHGTHFVLVDSHLRIRGYYDSTEADVEDRLLHDAAMLINRGD